MPNLGGGELIFVLLIVLIVFGAGKLKDVGRDLGKGIKEFRSAMTEPETTDPKDQQNPSKP